MNEYMLNKLKIGSVYGETVYNICAGKEIFVPKPHYLDASVCAKTFYLIAEEWWNNYESFAFNLTKNYCLKQYWKWVKYAKIFERSC